MGERTDRPGGRVSLRARKRTLQWPVLLALMLTWVLLWGDLSFANVLSGLVVAIIGAMVFPLPPIRFAGTFRPLGLSKLVSRFALDLMVASVGVATRALDARRQPMNAIIAVPLHTRSDLYLTLTAELLSLIPGSVVVEADRSSWTLYLHVFGVEDERDITQAHERALRQEERLVRALGSDQELAEFARSKAEGKQP